ncbi:PEP-utilizing enzyme [Streptomyces rimosus]|uniref:PEP-utilizing enzyme n=1 Tax=Streptomyces rimosus TaxID=1927 RepID=UPI0037CF175D
MRHYLERLRREPQLHDKVEFAVLQSSYHFATPRHVASLSSDGVLPENEASEFVALLHGLTVDMLRSDGPYRQDLRTVRHLAERPLAPSDGTDTCKHFRHLLCLGRTEGALPFAGIARVAFVATSLVRSLTEVDVLSAEEADALLASADTVSHQLRKDFAAGDREMFLRRHGHLRPGTYDILSPRYDETESDYFDWPSRLTTVPAEPVPYRAGPSQLRAIGRLLDAHRFPLSPEDFIQFVRDSVAAREYAKHQYSRVVSDMLTCVRRTGERLGFGTEEMSYVTVDTLAALTGDDRRDRRILAAAASRGEERYAVTRTLHAPALLSRPDELVSFVALDTEPNFVAHARVIARVADVDSGEPLDGAIAMIPAADPGYDWIFTHHIVGLVTAYGGANSHMAVRALELGLPAVIGAGDARFRQWMSAGTLEIDTSNRLVRPLTATAARQGGA